MSESRRLFFALWPDNDIRRGIVERCGMLGQISRKRVPDHNLHLTLVFLGDQPAGRLPEFESAAEAVSAARCELRLDRFGWFARARVAWLGGEAPENLAGLQADLGSAMIDLGLNLDRRPFRPHVTLFRKVSRRPAFPQPTPLVWPVAEFALVDSVPNRPYSVLRSWPLAAD